MFFNLINAFAIFQTYINKSLINLLNDFCVIYLNNILIFLKMKIKHLKHVQKILN